MKSFIITFAILAMSSICHAEDPSTPLGAGKPRKHLFLLSGQSNMSRMAKHQDGVFNKAVEKAFGKENVTVVLSAEGGKAIRYWDKDYEFPADRPIPRGSNKTSEPKKNGYRYDMLMKALERKTTGKRGNGIKKHDTVTFVWMQGETDAGDGLSDLYIDSLNRIVARLKSDLGVDSINIVTGRLCDFDGAKYPDHWEKMRELQVQYAKERPNCEWVNCDDLNDETLEADGHCVKRTVPIRAGKQAADGITYLGKGGYGIASRNTAGWAWYLQKPGFHGEYVHIMVLSFTKDKIDYYTKTVDDGIVDEWSFKVRQRQAILKR